MSKKVLITGATEDTGRASVQEAIAVGLDVRAMVRKIDELWIPTAPTSYI